MVLLHPLQMVSDCTFDTSETGRCKYYTRIEVCRESRMVFSMAGQKKREEEEKNSRRNKKGHFYCSTIFKHARTQTDENFGYVFFSFRTRFDKSSDKKKRKERK